MAQRLADGEFRHEIDGVVEVVIAGVVKGGHRGVDLFPFVTAGAGVYSPYQERELPVK